MTRCVAFLLALLFAALTVSSACVAADPRQIHFTLEGDRGRSEIRANFRDNNRNRGSDWSSGLPPSKLIGLDIAGFYSAGARPLRFSIVREAGRLDCAGQGGAAFATGNCGFSPDPGFTQLLVSRGIGRPTFEQSFGLMAVDARRALIDSVAGARYPMPTIDQLMALSALGVSAGYIDELARVGFRPSSIQSLIEFKAMNISARYVGALASLGYGGTPPADLVALKALNVTPDYIAAFQHAGYHHIPPSKLLQLKALDITPEEVRAAETQPGVMPPVEQLMSHRH